MENSAGYGIEATEPKSAPATTTEAEQPSECATPAASGIGEAVEDATATEGIDNTPPIDGEEEQDGGIGNEAEAPVDYERIMREDLEVLRANFPELSELRDISELSGAMRYAALRDLGLTAIEAYLATSQRVNKRDSRAHLSTAVSRTAGAPRGAMSRGELSVARELFSGLSDAQIYNLYKKVTQ